MPLRDVNALWVKLKHPGVENVRRWNGVVGEVWSLRVLPCLTHDTLLMSEAILANNNSDLCINARIHFTESYIDHRSLVQITAIWSATINCSTMLMLIVFISGNLLLAVKGKTALVIPTRSSSEKTIAFGRNWGQKKIITEIRIQTTTWNIFSLSLSCPLLFQSSFKAVKTDLTADLTVV